MKCLIIEDDKNKAFEIKNFLESNYLTVETTIVHSYSSGLKEAISTNYDYILLDMSMPTFDITHEEKGGRPRHFAGKEIIQQMHRRNVCTPVIVITQFENFGEGDERITLEELNQELHELSSQAFKGSIYYNIVEKNWQKKLLEFIGPLK